MEAIAVLLVEASPTFRQIAVRFLSEQHRISLVGVVGDAREMLLLAHTVRPRVVVLDLAATDPPGLVAIASLRKTMPDTGIVAVGLIEQGYRQAALGAGADAFLTKERMGTSLVSAIRFAARAGARRSVASRSSGDKPDPVRVTRAIKP